MLSLNADKGLKEGLHFGARTKTLQSFRLFSSQRIHVGEYLLPPRGHAQITRRGKGEILSRTINVLTMVLPNTLATRGAGYCTCCPTPMDKSILRDTPLARQRVLTEVLSVQTTNHGMRPNRDSR